MTKFYKFEYKPNDNPLEDNYGFILDKKIYSYIAYSLKNKLDGRLFFGKKGNMYFIFTKSHLITDITIQVDLLYSEKGMDGISQSKNVGGLFLTLDKTDGHYYPPSLSMDALFVKKPFQRRGIATALYDYAEQVLDLKIKPSKTQSTDAKAFWANRKKSNNMNENKELSEIGKQLKFIINEEKLGNMYEYEDDEDEYMGDFDLKQFLERLRPQMAKTAQKVYDAWDQDDSGHSEGYGSGGICHDIESAMASVVYEHSGDGDEEVRTFGFRDDYACHNYFVAYHPPSKEMYEVDIPPYNYEKGGGYTWKKIHGITFHPDQIEIRQFAGDYDEWIDEEGWPRDDIY